MNSTIQKILVPITTDAHFSSTLRFAVDLANQCCASITFLAVDDDSQCFETAALPFHKREFVHHPTEPELLRNVNTRGNLSEACSQAADQGALCNVVACRGHSASEVLFLSRFHDLVIISDHAEFPCPNENKLRPVNPIIEILDQCVVPVILSGSNAKRQIEEIELYYDGSPCSTRAMHSVANLFQPWPETCIHVRAISVNQSIAQKLAEQAAGFFQSRGFENIQQQHDYREAVSSAFSSERDRKTQLVAMGVNSQQPVHPELGFLAEHFLYDEPGKHKLFL